MLLAMAITLLGLGIRPVQATTATADLAKAINNARATQHIQPLRYSYTLQLVARHRLADMITGKYFGHQSSAGLTYRYWLNFGPAKFSQSGENIASDYRAADDAVTGWMASGTHKNNLIDSQFTHQGVAAGMVRINGQLEPVWVAVFGRSANSL